MRLPSSFSGLFGIKAQFGRVPVFPVSATPTLAHVGPLARTVRDAALLLGVIAGHDRRDPFSLAGTVPDFVGACDLPVKGMRVAWSATLGYGRPEPEVVAACEAAVKVLEGLGCEIVDWDGAPEFDTKPRKSLIYIGRPSRIATTGGSIERFGLVFSNSMRPAHWPVGR